MLSGKFGFLNLIFRNCHNQSFCSYFDILRLSPAKIFTLKQGDESFCRQQYVVFLTLYSGTVTGTVLFLILTLWYRRGQNFSLKKNKMNVLPVGKILFSLFDILGLSHQNLFLYFDIRGLLTTKILP